MPHGPTQGPVPFEQQTEALQAAGILEVLGQGVCVVAGDATLLWCNPAFQAYAERVREEIRAACAKLCVEFDAERDNADAPRTRRHVLDVDRDHCYELLASGLVATGEGVAGVVAAAWDVTAVRRLREKLDAIDAAGRELMRLDADATAEMELGERLGLLEDRIIRHMHELMRFDHFIVRVLDRESRRLETVMAGGMSEEAKSLDLYAADDDCGISGHVAATGRSHICTDISRDTRYLPGIDDARSSLTVPLRLHDQVVGILNIESRERAAFGEDDRQLADIFGRYIAMALHVLKLLVVERKATTGQLASDVTAELAAPLNDIVTEATHIMEEYIGQDDLRRRLQAIIDNVDRAKRGLKSVTESPGLRGLVPATNDRDPIIDGKCILIADDEEIIRETVSDVLTKAGALTLMAKDGDEAVTLIRSRRFDLVVSDIKMPRKNGYEVFAAAKQADARCPVILITGFGYDPNHSIVRASKNGLAAVLYKPFKVDKLLEEIHHALTTDVN